MLLKSFPHVWLRRTQRRVGTIISEWSPHSLSSQVRRVSCAFEVHPDVVNAPAVTMADSRTPGMCFEDLGLHQPIVSALHAAYPHVEMPTGTQVKLIPAVLSGKDVLLKDDTGSGKSFGLVLALLSKPRVIQRGNSGKGHITSLVLVPHRDLALQLAHWVEQIGTAAAFPSLPSLVQVLVRSGTSHLTTTLSSIRQTPPHILIGTPQGVLDVYREDPEALQLERLSAVAVDEVDYLIETLPRKEVGKSYQKAAEKARKKLKAHPGVTRELLDIIFRERKEENKGRKDEAGAWRQRRVEREGRLGSGSPQLILSSATLRRHLNNYLFDESGWLNKEWLVKVKGEGKRADVVDGEKRPAKHVHDGLGGAKIEHSVLVVSEADIRNIDGAVDRAGKASEGVMDEINPMQVFGEAGSSAAEAVETGLELAQKYRGTPSPFNPNALEAIATGFALDVPRMALLVLPGSSSVQRAVFELREMGVNARGLDVGAGGEGPESGTPTLLVATVGNIRGLDLPELSHVFVLGVPDGARVTGKGVDAYVHLAGRLGRRGQSGRVVTLVWDEADSERMARILRTIGSRPTRFEHFS